MTMKKEEKRMPVLLVTIDGYDINNDNTLVSPIELTAIAMQEQIISDNRYEACKELERAGRKVYEVMDYPDKTNKALDELAGLIEDIEYYNELLSVYDNWYLVCAVIDDDGTYWTDSKIGEWLYYNRFNLV